MNFKGVRVSRGFAGDVYMTPEFAGCDTGGAYGGGSGEGGGGERGLTAPRLDTCYMRLLLSSLPPGSRGSLTPALCQHVSYITL